MKNTLDIHRQTTLGELVTYFPDVTPRLTAHHIDFCCQGDRPLEQALEEAGLDAAFMDEIVEDYRQYLQRPDKQLPVTELSNRDLIDRIIREHHVPERRLWQELDPMINKILLVHYEHDKEGLLALHREFSFLKMELENHFAKEECELFPEIFKVDEGTVSKDEVRALIEELEGEHDAAGDIIKRIIRLTDDFTPPAYACPTVKVVYAKLHELIDDVFLHIVKENSVLFKRF